MLNLNNIYPNYYLRSCKCTASFLFKRLYVISFARYHNLFFLLFILINPGVLLNLEINKPLWSHLCVTKEPGFLQPLSLGGKNILQVSRSCVSTNSSTNLLRDRGKDKTRANCLKKYCSRFLHPSCKCWLVGIQECNR